MYNTIISNNQIFNVNELLNESYFNCEYVGETIEKKSEIIADKLTYNREAKRYLSYMFREIMRNVVEHSKSRKFVLKYSSNMNDVVKFEVIDNGIGIRNSLNSNQYFDFSKDEYAIIMSIQPGITKAYRKVRRRSNDVWQNSGFGLYMVSSICQQDGLFSIKSGDCEIEIKNNNINIYSGDFYGTKVKVEFKYNNKLEPLSHKLMKLSKAGSEMAKSYNINTFKTASHASTVLINYCDKA